MAKQVKIKGIQRNSDAPDGSCDEIINMRYRYGAWRPIRPKHKVYDKPAYDTVYSHVQDNFSNYIGYNKTAGTIVNFDPSTGTVKQTLYTLASGETLNDIKTLKRFCIVITSLKLHVFLYDLSTYNEVGNILPPQIIPSSTGAQQYTTDVAPISSSDDDTASALKGKIYTKLNDLSSNSGIHTSGLYIRAAYRLFDSTYIMASNPMFCKLCDGGISINSVSGGRTATFSAATLQLNVPLNYYTQMGSCRNIISALVVFATKMETFWDTEAITASMISPGENDDYLHFVKNADAWYKIYEYSFSDILDAKAGLVTPNLKNYYQNYAALESMPSDNYSWHTITGTKAYIYNDRLVLGNITTKLADLPDQQGNVVVGSDLGLSNYKVDSVNQNIICDVYTNFRTTSGTKVTKQQITFPLYQDNASMPANNQVCILLNPVVYYPDARAESIQLFVAGTQKQIASIPLTAGQNNFAYYESGVKECLFYVFKIDYSDLQTVTPPTEDRIILDTNRVQISELRDPFNFDLTNSYQVGTGTILNFGTNSEPLSEGQFGQFPLQVFTDEGVFAMQEGSGSVLYSRVTPLNQDVPIGPVCSMEMGVMYATTNGLFLLTGRGIQKISASLEGLVNRTLTKNNNYEYFFNNSKLATLVHDVSRDDFITYLNGAIYAYDATNKEIVVSNPAYDYSYLYSTQNNVWYKLTLRIYQFISVYPSLLAVSDAGVYDLCTEDFGDVQIAITTRPVNFDMENIRKKLGRIVLRCILNVSDSHYLGFYVYGSEDGLQWQLITGSDKKQNRVHDAMILEAHRSMKFFVFQIVTTVKTGANPDDIPANSAIFLNQVSGNGVVLNYNQFVSMNNEDFATKMAELDNKIISIEADVNERYSDKLR